MVLYTKKIEAALSVIKEKKEQLDAYFPISPALILRMNEWFCIELTYTSNALEGNTLSRKETALIVEKGITIGGKSLLEHLEARNHAKSVFWIQEHATRKPESVCEEDILHLHNIILEGIYPEYAGRYRDVGVRVAGSLVIFPNWKKVPTHMQELCTWLQETKEEHPILYAAKAHYKLVTIHPFVDGNGRSARLLMNWLLLMQGYPSAIIRPKERLAYLEALEKAQLGGSSEDYFLLIIKAIERSITMYLNVLEDKTKEREPIEHSPLLTIGALAKKTGETNATLRHWTREGLLPIEKIKDSGYFLYAVAALERIKEIHRLKQQRYSLREIKKILDETQ